MSNSLREASTNMRRNAERSAVLPLALSTYSCASVQPSLVLRSTNARSSLNWFSASCFLSRVLTRPYNAIFMPTSVTQRNLFGTLICRAQLVLLAPFMYAPQGGVFDTPSFPTVLRGASVTSRAKVSRTPELGTGGRSHRRGWSRVGKRRGVRGSFCVTKTTLKPPTDSRWVGRGQQPKF